MASETGMELKSLLKIFPNEIWNMVLQNVHKVRDYLRICSAAPEFRVLAHSRAPLILFLEVIRLLLPEDSLEQDLPMWIKIRQVCRPWKTELDNVLQKPPDYFSKPDEKTLFELPGIAFNEDPIYINSLSFESPEEFGNFEKHFDPTHLVSGANPFLHRKVNLSFTDESGSPEPNYAACVRMFEKYGHHLWYCILGYEFDEEDTHTDFFSRKLPAILDLMPNLRALHIDNPNERDLSHDFPDDTELAQLPTLPYLDYIYPHFSPHAFVERLLQRNPHVKYADVMLGTLPSRCVLTSIPLTNLRGLSVTLMCASEVRELHNAQCTRLERLWVDLSDMTPVRIERVFRALEHSFSETLVELHLRLRRGEKMRGECRLVLPRLKLFDLEMRKPQTLDFLLPLKGTLEELRFAVDFKPDCQVNCRFELDIPGQHVSGRSNVQVFKFWKELEKSNLWTLFPKLAVLETKLFKRGEMPEKYVCSRKEWQAKMEARIQLGENI